MPIRLFAFVQLDHGQFAAPRIERFTSERDLLLLHLVHVRSDPARLLLELGVLADQVFHLGPLGAGKRRRRGVTDEEGRRHQVDPYVGALGRKNRRHQQLVRGLVVQLAARGRVFSLEQGQNVAGSAPEHRAGFPGPRLAPHDRLGRFALHPRLARAKARNSSTVWVLSRSARVSHPFRAMPTP